MSVKTVGPLSEVKESAPVLAQASHTTQGIGQTPSSLDCASCCSGVIHFFEWVVSGLIYLWTWLTTDGPVMPEPTALEKEALDFAEKELEKAGPNTSFCGMSALNVKDPVNCKVRQMMTLYRQARARFENPLAKHTVEDEQIKEAAKRCLYLGYAIGYLTLKNLPKDIVWLNEVNKDAVLCPRVWNYTTALTNYCTYQSLAILLVAQVYHRMKGHVVWNDDKCKFQFPETVSPEYSARFYQEGAIENNFRKLHNDLCNRAWLYLEKEELGAFHDHYEKWLQEDTREKPLPLDPEMLNNPKLDPLGLHNTFGYMSVGSQSAYYWNSVDLPASVADNKS